MPEFFCTFFCDVFVDVRRGIFCDVFVRDQLCCTHCNGFVDCLTSVFHSTLISRRRRTCRHRRRRGDKKASAAGLYEGFGGFSGFQDTIGGERYVGEVQIKPGSHGL